MIGDRSLHHMIKQSCWLNLASQSQSCVWKAPAHCPCPCPCSLTILTIQLPFPFHFHPRLNWTDGLLLFIDASFVLAFPRVCPSISPTICTYVSQFVHLLCLCKNRLSRQRRDPALDQIMTHKKQWKKKKKKGASIPLQAYHIVRTHRWLIMPVSFSLPPFFIRCSSIM